MNYLKIDELKDGYLYKIRARNSHLGIWLEKKGKFLISGFECGGNYLFEEIHWDLNKRFGTVKPLEEIEKAPFEPEDLGILEDTTTEEGKLCRGYRYYDEILQYLNEKGRNNER